MTKFVQKSKTMHEKERDISVYRVTYIGFCFNYMYMYHYNDSIVKLVHVLSSYIFDKSIKKKQQQDIKIKTLVSIVTLD